MPTTMFTSREAIPRRCCSISQVRATVSIRRDPKEVEVAKIAILYGTAEGQAAKISEHTEEARAQTEGYVERFLEETGWHPDMVGIFAGALRYTQYGFIKRHLMKKISKDGGSADTDTSRDYEYTDWNDVRHFAEEFLEGLI